MIILDDGVNKFDFRNYNAEIAWEHENQAQPNFETLTSFIPKKAGLKRFGTNVKSRNFKLTVYLDTIDLEKLDSFIYKLNRFIMDGYGEPKRLKAFILYERKYRYVILSTPSIPKIGDDYNSLELDFVSLDPYKYNEYNADDVVWGSEVITFEDHWLLGNTGSQAYNIDIDRRINLNLNIEGTSVNPKIEINGSGKNVSLYSGNKRIYLGDFSSATIIVNTGNYTSTINGDAILFPIDLNWSLTKDYDLEVVGDEMKFNLKVHYNDRYI